MPWGRVEDDLHDNGKVATLSDRAFRVWWYSISYCNKKRREDPDGHLTRTEAADLCQRHTQKPLTRAAVLAVIRELSEPSDERESVFWEPTGKGFIVHDFHQYGPSRTPVTPEPKDPTAADRQRRHRDKSRSPSAAETVTDTVTQTVTEGVTNGVTHMHARPVPVPGPEPGSSPPENPQLETDTPVVPATARAQGLTVVPAAGQIKSLHVALLKAAEIAFGHVGQSENEKRKHRTLVHQLATADPPVTVDEFGELVAEYRRRRWPNPGLQAVVNHLGDLRSAYEPGGKVPNGSSRPEAYDALADTYADLNPHRASGHGRDALEAG